MPIVKCTSLFKYENSNGKAGGFSETWYFDGTQAAASAAFIPTIRKRMDCTNLATTCMGVRFQTLGGPTTTGILNIPGTLNADREIPQMALNIRALSLNGQYKKLFQLRALADNVVVGGTYQPGTTTMAAALSAYAKSLFDNTILFRVLSKDEPKVSIQSIAADGTFVLPFPLTYANGDTIQVMNCRNTLGKKVNGFFFASDRVDAQNGKLANWTGGIVQGNGKFRRKTYIYTPIGGYTLWELRDITTRKVGRPFAVYHGRRQKR